MHILSPLERSLPKIIFTTTQYCQYYLISSDEETETQKIKTTYPRTQKLILVRAKSEFIS